MILPKEEQAKIDRILQVVKGDVSLLVLSSEGRYVLNDREEWVPEIPPPLVNWPGYRCPHCSRFSWLQRAYRGHFALVHILKMQDKS